MRRTAPFSSGSLASRTLWPIFLRVRAGTGCCASFISVFCFVSSFLCSPAPTFLLWTLRNFLSADSAKATAIPLAKFRKYWKLGAAFLLLVLVAQFGLNLILRIHRVRQSMIARLERAFGRRVEVQSFTAALLPPGLDAEGITGGEDPAFGNEYFLRADHLSARLRLFSLLAGHLEFGTLSLDHPSLILVKNSEGRWNLERWLPPAPPGDSVANRPPASRPPDEPAARLSKIGIKDGR